MAKCKQVMLKNAEISYLLHIAMKNFEEGRYWGRKDYFEAMQDKVIKKLKVAENIKAPKQYN